MRRVPRKTGDRALLHKEYVEAREKEVHRPAMYWEDIVWEAEKAVGKDDAQSWVEHMEQGVMQNPYFLRDPLLAERTETVKGIIQRLFPQFEGKTWAYPHPDAWCKLGWYRVWRPDLFMFEVYGEGELLAALKDNEKH
jgi:hypothetical protein